MSSTTTATTTTLWSHIEGTKGLSRVRVFERASGGPLWVEWRAKGKRKREPLSNFTGHSVYEKDLAKRFALELSEAIRREKEGDTLRELLGKPKVYTLGQLLEALHTSARAKRWRPNTLRLQNLYRRRWLLWLGADMPLSEITPAVASEKAAIAARKLKWSPATEKRHLVYLRDAFLFGQKKLKWYGEEGNLSALEMPREDGVSLPYSELELLKLIPACYEVDLRLAGAAEIAYATQRRIGAIRLLEQSDYRVEEVETLDGVFEVGVLNFRGENDKARKTGDAVLTEDARQVVERLIQRYPGHIHLLPSTPERALSERRLNDLLHEAEEHAGIDYVRGRAFHGIKRRTVTMGAKLTGGDMGAVSKQSGTLEQTLRTYYLQDDLDRKLQVAQALQTRKGTLKIAS